MSIQIFGKIIEIFMFMALSFLLAIFFESCTRMPLNLHAKFFRKSFACYNLLVVCMHVVSLLISDLTSFPIGNIKI